MKESSETVLIIGASTNPRRYAYKATEMLLEYGHTPILIGRQKGQVLGLEIQDHEPANIDVDTVTLYINERIQPQYMSYIKSLKPQRVIFNPGTESTPSYKELKDAGIECIEACTLVMLRTNQF